MSATIAVSPDAFVLLDSIRASSTGLTSEELRSRAAIKQVTDPDRAIQELGAKGLIRFDQGCNKHPDKYNATPRAWNVCQEQIH